jgi:hypothetical protein
MFVGKFAKLVIVICLWSCASASSNPCQQVHSTVKRGMIDRIKPARLVQTVLDPDNLY